MTAVQSAEELRLVEEVRAGNEQAFTTLVERHQPSMLRLATLYVRNPSVAEEVVQDAWLGVLNGLDRFEGRSSLKTWIFRILVNRAKTRAEREGRTVPFSSLGDAATEDDAPSVDPSRFLPAGDRFAHHWAAPPTPWDEMPEKRLLALEAGALIAAAVEALAPAQRQVITLRDLEGWSSEEVCNVLGLSETNQRVLLHRARTKVRRALEEYVEEESRSS